MASDEDSKTPYRPALSPMDSKAPDEPSRSMDQSSYAAGTSFPKNYSEYAAKLDDLRLLTPYLSELKRRLGDTCHVVQFRSPFDFDSIPNEFRHKDRPLLWKVEVPGSVCWVTDQDNKTFYFPSSEQSSLFLKKMTEDASEASSLEAVLDARNNLNKFLW